MSFSARFPTTSLYRVEVSGWDKSQTFFVEKPELQWNEESGKHVTLIQRRTGRFGGVSTPDSVAQRRPVAVGAL
jgi:hypothetical protein